MGLLDLNLPGIGIKSPNMSSYTDEVDVSISKSSKMWDLFDSSLKGLETAPKDGDYEAFIQTYCAITWVYTCVWILSTSIASVPLRLYKGRYDKKIPVDEDGPAYKLIMRPNNDEMFTELLEELVVGFELTGCGYWEKFFVPNALNNYPKNLPLKLYNIEPSRMEVIPDSINKIKGYVYNKGQGKLSKEFKPEEICVFRYPNPVSPFYGQGVIKPLQSSLITELYRETYNKTYFENDARPDFAIIHNADVNKGIGPLQPDAMKRLATAWQKAFGGPKKTRLPVVMESGTDLKILSDNPKDMDFREMEKSLRERILSAFGVYPAILGLVEDQNYGNAKEQVKLFWSVTIPPKLNRISSAITRQILQPYQEDMWCEFDDTVIKALEESPKEHEERLSRMLERGGITLGEYRQSNGFTVDEKDEYKDKRFISANLIPLADAFLPDVEPEGGIATGAEGSIAGESQNNEGGNEK